MKKAFLYALALHALIALFFISDLRFLFREKTVTSKPLIIDYVTISKETAAPKKSPKKVADKEVTKSAEKEKVKEEAKAEEAAENAQRNKKDDLKDPETENKEKAQKPKPKKKPLKPKEKPKKPAEKKKASKQKEKAKTPPQKKKASKKKAQIDIKKEKDGKKDAKKKNASLDDVFDKIDQEQDNSADTENIAPVLTASDIDALRQKIAKCWVVPAGTENAENMVVDIDMKIAKDGHVVKAEINDKARMKRDGLFKIAAESAQRAVLDPECNPLPLPLSKYEEWKDLTMSFNPKDMF